MARKRGKNSKQTLGNLGLEKEEDAVLLQLLKKKDTSLKRLQRLLTREWVKQNQHLLNEKK